MRARLGIEQRIHPSPLPSQQIGSRRLFSPPRPHLLHGHLNRYSDPLNASSADTQAAFADQIADEFGQALTEKYQVQVSGLNRSEVDFDDIDRLVKYYPDGD